MRRNPFSFDKLFQLEERSVPAAIRFAPTSDSSFGQLCLQDDRIAVRFQDRSDAVGVNLVRWLDSTTAVIEASEVPENALFAVPVLTNLTSHREVIAVDEVIVALNPKTPSEAFFDNDRFANFRPLWGTTDQFVATLKTGRGMSVIETAESLARDPRVQWTEPNFYQDWQLFFDPNDTEYAASNMWHHVNTGQGGGLADADVDTDLAWNLNAGGSANRLISIVDDGLETTHPDLNPWINPGEVAGDGKDNDNNGYIDDVHGWNFFSNNNVYITVNADRHGTAVAGVAAAKGNNALGVVGPSYNARVMVARIFENNTATSDANIASAVYYAAGRNKSGIGSFASVDVMNNSWGGAAYSSSLASAFNYATSNGRNGLGTVTLAATGNGYAGGIAFPAMLAIGNPGLIAVGATNNKGTRSDYSNFGNGLDLVAPSSDLRGGYLGMNTTDRVGGPGYNGTDYTGTGPGSFGGTSAATPLAAGIAGLVLSQAEDKGIVLTATQMRSYLRNTTDLIGGATYSLQDGTSLEFGRGRINAFTAVDGVGKPELSVVSTTKEIINGATASMGNASINGSVTQTFRIRNAGTSDLTLNSLAVTSENDTFTVDSNFSDTTLSIGESTTFAIRFAPTSTTADEGTVSFSSNDADENSFSFKISGSGTTANASGRAFEDRNGNSIPDGNDNGLAGRTIFLDANANSLPDRVSFTSAVNQTIPDNNANGLSNALTVSGVTVPVRGLTVTVNLTHQFLGDVTLYLVSPAGTAIQLAGYVGGGGTSFTNTIFDDAGPISIHDGASPFTGRFRVPFEPMSRFDGESANGTWTFIARDTGPGDTGMLVNWGLELDAEAVTVTDSQGLFALNAPVGNYKLRHVMPNGWIATAGNSGYDANIITPATNLTGFEFGSAKINRAYLRVRDDQNADGFLSPGEPGVSGRVVFADANNNDLLDLAAPPAVISKTANLVIPDDDPQGTVSTVNVSSLTGTILDVNVTVNVTHTAVGDLRLNLRSPAGTVVTLVNRRGTDGVNFKNTSFDDTSLVPAVNMLNFQSPFNSVFSPETPLAAIIGESPNGNWMLEAFDLDTLDNGTLVSWSLSVTTGESEASSISLPNGNATLDLPAGSTSVLLEPLAGWKFTNPADGKQGFLASGMPLYEQTFGVAEAIPPTMSLAINDGDLQRSIINNLRIDFSEHVFFSGPVGKTFTINGPSGSIPFTATVDDIGPATIVTLSFTPLEDGKYSLATNAVFVNDVALNPLVSPGVLQFHRLLGDFNGDATVDAGDFAIFGNGFGSSTGDPAFFAPADFNDDGLIDASDFADLGNRFGISL